MAEADRFEHDLFFTLGVIEQIGFDRAGPFLIPTCEAKGRHLEK